MDETAASLRIVGDDLVPDEITDILGFPPTIGRKKGDKRQGKNTKKIYTAPTGIWNLSSPRGSGDLESHIRWLFEVIPSDVEIWKSLACRFELDLFCGLFLDDWNRSVLLDSPTLLFLGERGIDLTFDIYSPCTEDE